MCGIIGCTGRFDTAGVLLAGLEKLEYRGYDSAGVALLCDGDIRVVKCKGRLDRLRKKTEGMDFSNCRTGIGHTRWATHGEPSDLNSHPHVSNSGKFCVVHNGIIENHMEIMKDLENEGYTFSSQTDSEVIAHLLEYNFEGDVIEALTKTVAVLEGSYALGVVCSLEPDCIFSARKDSPLILGMTDKGGIIASDIPALLEYTRDVYIAEDGEIARIGMDAIEFYNTLGAGFEKEAVHIDWDAGSAEKEGFEHFMLKEIHEEPTAIKSTLTNRSLESIELGKPGKIHVVACGTAYHAGIVGKHIIEDSAEIPVEVHYASEFRYGSPIINKGDLTIVISQSGETIDTLYALRKAAEKGSGILAVVNVVGSSIAREADNVFYTRAGPEIAVASTKAYSTQLAAMYMIASKLSGGKLPVDELYKIPMMIEKILSAKEKMQKFASELFGENSIFFIGRGLDYALSMEGSLKLKEISYIHSEAYAGGELKHGTIALIEKGTPVVCSMTQPSVYKKMAGNLKEVKARGARTLVITMESMAAEASDVADMIVTIPDIDPLFAPVTAITPMQLFAYYCAVLKGCDVDKPRNLAKSVTVE